MVQFLLDNSVFLIFALFVLGNAAHWFYDNFCYKETRDDWFQVLMFVKMAKKSYLRHPEFVGRKIKLSDDTHIVKHDEDGSLTRVERGEI